MLAEKCSQFSSGREWSSVSEVSGPSSTPGIKLGLDSTALFDPISLVRDWFGKGHLSNSSQWEVFFLKMGHEGLSQNGTGDMNVCVSPSRPCHSMWHLQLELPSWDNEDKPLWRYQNRRGKKKKNLCSCDDFWLLTLFSLGFPHRHLLVLWERSFPSFHLVSYWLSPKLTSWGTV